MTTINLKELAYTTLSDAGQFGKHKVNIYKVARQAGFTHDVRSYDDGDYRGKLGRNDYGYELVTSENLSSLEKDFEVATLLAFALLQPNLPKVLPKGYAIQHFDGAKSLGMNMATHLAGILMAYSFSKKELSYIDAPKGELKIAKLAKKKGIPTRILLQRMSEVTDGVNIDFDDTIQLVNLNKNSDKQG